MKAHTTNYTNTFIAIAEDCPIEMGEIPPTKVDAKSIATLQFELLSQNPYKFSSDDVIFQVYAARKGITKKEFKTERKEFFSKGQACFRASPLTKRYGWGIHNNTAGKIALFGSETPEYQKFMADDTIIKKKAMRSKRT